MPYLQNITNLKSYFTAEAIARRITELPPLNSPIMDIVYRDRVQHPFATIALEEVKEQTGLAPVIRRGTASYPVSTDSGSLAILDPQPVSVSDFLSAKDIGDIFSAGRADSIDSFVNNKIDKLRRICRRTTEILAAQSISGKIAYPMATQSGTMVDYTVDYGTATRLADTDLSTATVGAIIKQLETIYKALQDAGHSTDIVYLAGDDVYALLADKVTSAKNLSVNFEKDGMLIAGKYKVIPMGVTYKKPGSNTASYIVDPKEICAIDRAAGHRLYYCALDDLDARLAPLPFYAKPVTQDDPSGLKIIGTSKPLPAPVLSAIVWQKLLP